MKYYNYNSDFKIVEPLKAEAPFRFTYYTKKEVDAKIPTKTSQLTNDSGFLTKHQDISGKQDKIADLDAIRAGAAKGATALQSVPSNYATKSDLQAAINESIIQVINSAL